MNIVEKIMRDLEPMLDKIVKESEDNAKNLNKNLKEQMIRHEQLIQEYAVSTNKQKLLEESEARMSTIQAF